MLVGAEPVSFASPVLLSAGCPTSPSLVDGHRDGHTDTWTCEWTHGRREGQTDTRLPGVGWGGSAQGGVSPVVVQDRPCQCLLGTGWGEGLVSWLGVLQSVQVFRDRLLDRGRLLNKEC